MGYIFFYKIKFINMNYSSSNKNAKKIIKNQINDNNLVMKKKQNKNKK